MPAQPPHTGSPIDGINSLNELPSGNTVERLLLCSIESNPALARHCELEGIELEHCQTLEALETLGRFDTALVVDWLEHHTHAEGIQLLARLRNLHTPHIWLMLKETDSWSMNDLLGLGFRRQSQQQHGGGMNSSYAYHLASYNHKRSWNNAKHWANPQNWNKYWW